jgi:hypothetical protein
MMSDCENVVAKGTKKYPVENEYSSFLSAHGGSSNAYTATEHTNYYFDIGAEHLEGALDRFARFFYEPLFDDSCTERELLAVDSGMSLLILLLDVRPKFMIENEKCLKKTKRICSRMHGGFINWTKI